MFPSADPILVCSVRPFLPLPPLRPQHFAPNAFLVFPPRPYESFVDGHFFAPGVGTFVDQPLWCLKLPYRFFTQEEPRPRKRGTVPVFHAFLSSAAARKFFLTAFAIETLSLFGRFFHCSRHRLWSSRFCALFCPESRFFRERVFFGGVPRGHSRCFASWDLRQVLMTHPSSPPLPVGRLLNCCGARRFDNRSSS